MRISLTVSLVGAGLLASCSSQPNVVRRCQMQQQPSLAIAANVMTRLDTAKINYDKRFFSHVITEEVINHYMQDYDRCVGQLAPAERQNVRRMRNAIVEEAMTIAASVNGDPNVTTQAARQGEVDRRLNEIRARTVAQVPDMKAAAPIPVAQMPRMWPDRPTISASALVGELRRKGATYQIDIGKDVAEGISTAAITFAVSIHDNIEDYLTGGQSQRDVVNEWFITIRPALRRAVDDEHRQVAKRSGDPARAQ